VSSQDNNFQNLLFLAIPF